MNNYQKNVEINAQDVFLVSGGYRSLKVFQIIRLIQDITLRFTMLYIPYYSRTRDQMEQAARSGKQNIAEGSAAGVTSMETAIKLTNVAKASFLELLLDYEDFLRVRNFRQWEKDSAEVAFLRKKSVDNSVPDQWFVELGKSRPAETVANMVICFLHQEDYLLQAQLNALEKKFLALGGFKEQMFSARLKERNKNN